MVVILDKSCMKSKTEKDVSSVECAKNKKIKKSSCLHLTVCSLMSFASSFETNRSGCRVVPDQK